MVKTITKSPLHDVIWQHDFIAADESSLGHSSASTSRDIYGDGN